MPSRQKLAGEAASAARRAMSFSNRSRDGSCPSWLQCCRASHSVTHCSSSAPNSLSLLSKCQYTDPVGRPDRSLTLPMVVPS